MSVATPPLVAIATTLPRPTPTPTQTPQLEVGPTILATPLRPTTRQLTLTTRVPVVTASSLPAQVPKTLGPVRQIPVLRYHPLGLRPVAEPVLVVPSEAGVPSTVGVATGATVVAVGATTIAIRVAAGVPAVTSTPVPSPTGIPAVATVTCAGTAAPGPSPWTSLTVA